MEELTIPRLINIKESEIDTNENLKVIRGINDQLNQGEPLYVKMLRGDYEGSIALFTPDSDSLEDDVIRYTMGGRFNVINWWSGKLSWKGKKSNPRLLLCGDGESIILPNYEGDTILKRLNLKQEGDRMLAENTVEDVNGITLAEGDSVIYMNLRYGCGGKLCYGTIKKFKANVRQNFISVIITNNEDNIEESELNYPSMQIIKLNKETT